MVFPEDLRYSKTHEWVKTLEDGSVLIGITDYAQDALGDLVYINLPETGDSITAGEVFADVESVKAVSDVISPVTGTITEVNEELADAPEKLNQTPYEAWIVRVEKPEETEELMDSSAYEEFCRSLK